MCKWTGRLLYDVTTCSVNINFQESNYHQEFEFDDLPTVSVEKKYVNRLVILYV